MKIACRSTVAAILSVVYLVVPAPPGHAQELMEFTCDVLVPAYPPTGNVSCHGSGSYVGAGGPICARSCPTRAEISTISEDCVSDGFPLLAVYHMDITMSGSFVGGYRVERVGFHLTYYPEGSSQPAGEGWWQPHPPITTCAAPGPLAVTFTGELSVL